MSGRAPDAGADLVLTGTLSVIPGHDGDGIEILVIDESGDRYVLPLQTWQFRALVQLVEDAADLAASGPFYH